MSRAVRLGLGGCLAVALGVRLFFALTPHGVIDADEGIVGLMGRHVLRGEFPIFYYGQAYMGSLEPHLAALGFAVGGATPLALRLVCLAVALVLVWLTVELGRRILGSGPGLVAGLFMALPPIFVALWTIKARGGFIETLVLGTVALLVAHRLVETTGPRRLRAAVVLGLVGGLGWWTCQLVVSYLAAASLLVVRGAGSRVGLRMTPGVAIAFLAGSLPMWLHGWAAPLESPTVWTPAEPETAAQQLANVFTIGLPALLGPGGLWPALPAIEAVTGPLLAIYAIAWIVVLWARVRAWHPGLAGSPAAGAALDAVLALPVIAVLVCALSRFGWFVSEPRYLLPVATAVPVLVAALLLMLWRGGWRATATALGAAILTANLAGYFLAPWTAPGEAPRSLQAVLAFFEARRIPVVATTYWIGPRLAFESGERVVTVSIRGQPDRYPPYSALARRSDRLAYALLEGTADVGAIEERLDALGIRHDRTSLDALVVFHDLRLPDLDPTPPGLFYEALEGNRLPGPLLRIAAAYDAAGRIDRARPYLEAALEHDLPPGSRPLDRLLALYRERGESAKADLLAGRRVAAFTPASRREVDFGGAVRFLGHTLRPAVPRPGDRLEIVCFWSAPRPLDLDLVATILVIDGTHAVAGAGGPLAEGYSTTAWHADEVVRGAQAISLPRDLRPGRYALRIRLEDSELRNPPLTPHPADPGAPSRWLTLAEMEVAPPL